MRLAVYIALFAATCIGCDSRFAPDLIKSAGPNVEISRSIPFAPREVWIRDGIDVELVAGLASLELSGPQNILHEIETKFQDSTLILSDANTAKWVRSYNRVRIRVPAEGVYTIEQRGFGNLLGIDTIRGRRIQIRQYGAGHVQIPTVADVLELDLNGVGTLNLSGRARYTYVSLRKYARLEGAKLQTLVADVEQDGAGETLLYVQDSVRITQRGGGCAVFLGRPKVEVSTRKGTCIRLP